MKREIKRIEIQGQDLVVQVRGHNVRMAAGVLTEQIIPLIARGHLCPEEQAVVDDFIAAGLGVRGIIVREIVD